MTSQFEKLPNFRDVAQTVNDFQGRSLLKTGLFYRSARPDEATTADREKLLKDYHIRTIIDLRTTTELINAAKKYSEIAALAQSGLAPVPDSLIAAPLKIDGIDYAEVNLNGKGFERSLIWKLSYFSLAKVVYYMALGYRMEAIGIIGREVLLPRGLIGLGIDTLNHSGSEIKAIFDLLSNESTWPILVHCTQGKDRTGITVILVLLLCDIDIAAITNDYVRTESELAPERQERLQEVSSIGLDESFALCPKDFPEKIRQYIEDRHGTTKNYLESIGIEEDKLAQVRSILMAKSGQTQN